MIKLNKFFIMLVLLTSYTKTEVPTVTRVGAPQIHPVTVCDKRYATEMERALENFKSMSKIDLNITSAQGDTTSAAEQYMIKIKQFNDLDVRIREIESKILKLDTYNAALLRKPLAEYIKCKDALRTGTYSRHYYR